MFKVASCKITPRKGLDEEFLEPCILGIPSKMYGSTRPSGRSLSTDMPWADIRFLILMSMTNS